MKILFLVPYPLHESPSQRFRFEQYFSLLKEKGFHFKVQSFLSSHNWRLFYGRGHGTQKFLALLSGFVKRFFILFTVPSVDFVFIHREAAPIGPPVFEWIIAKIFRKKIIYDFDDAIWLTDRPNEGFFLRLAKWRNKVSLICRWSHKVSCGNEYLCSYARQFNSNVVLNPTTIDTQHVHNPDKFKKTKSDAKIIVGWTGSHSTLKYLSDMEGVFQQIETEMPHVLLMVIADRQPNLQLKNLVFRPWSEKTEIEDLHQFDIGIMPLADDEWAKGKCGFKALQYMAMEIPAIASPVGVNTSIIQHGQNGLLASTAEEWRDALLKLIEDPTLRDKMGKLGRAKVIQAYSVASNSTNFLALFAR